MTTGAITPVDYYTEKKVTAREPKKTLGKDDFLHLMITQLKNQDPLEPQTNEEFITTMTQFTSLETLSALESEARYSQAMSMIGKAVAVKQKDQSIVSGIVQKVGLNDDNKVVVYIDQQAYDITGVRLVEPQEISQRGPYDADLIQATVMIGKRVLIVDGDTELEGVVEKVSLSGGTVQVYVNGAAYDVSTIAEVSEAGGDTAPDTGS